MEQWEIDEWPVTVGQLVAKLQALPQDAKVAAIYDGFCHVDPVCVWLTRAGTVVMAAEGDVIYHDDDRPVSAPSEEEDAHWKAS